MWSALVFAAGAFFVWKMMKEADDSGRASEGNGDEKRDEPGTSGGFRSSDCQSIS